MAIDKKLIPEEAIALLGEAVGASAERDVAIYAETEDPARARRLSARSAEAQAAGGGVGRFVQMLRHVRL